MKKKLIVAIPMVIAAVLFALVALPGMVRADSNDQNSTDSTQTDSPNGSGGSDNTQADQQAAEAQKHAAEQAAEQAKHLAEQRQEAAKQRQEALDKQNEQDSANETEAKQQENEKAKEAFQKACETNRESFKARVQGVDTRQQQRIDVLNTIDDRIESYVQQHNLNVANYSTLLTAVKTQRQLVASLDQALKQTGEGFDCGTDKGQTQASLASFRDAYNQEINAINAYKTALKNLIAAVKSAAQTQGVQ